MRTEGFHIITSDQGDWIALYKDGKCLEQGHSISTRRLLELLQIECTSEEASEEQFDEWGGWAPWRLEA